MPLAWVTDAVKLAPLISGVTHFDAAEMERLFRPRHPL